jgi:hypothetical protein
MVRRLFALILLTLIFLAGTALAATGDVEKIRQAIAEKGANWQVEETPYSHLSLAEKRAMLGLLPGLADEEALNRRPRFGRQIDDVDEEVDWRDRNGSNWVTPVKNQGQCGSCWAFGGVAAMESNILIYANLPDYPLDLSEQYLVSCSDGSCNGWYADATLDFLQDEGTVDEPCLPYTGSDITPCSQRCDDYLMRNVNLSDWGQCYDAADMKSVLNVGPISICFEVFEDFFSYSGGVYQHVWGQSVGGHMISIVGYSEAQGAWICKNSWGASWGNDGYFLMRMGYDECGIESWAPLWCIPDVMDYPLLTVSDFVISETVGDHDGVLNPGETAQVFFTLHNGPLARPATEILVQIAIDDPRITIQDNQAGLPDLAGSQSVVSSDPLIITAAPNCALGPVEITVYIYANESSPLPYYVESTTTLPLNVFQFGYPLPGFQMDASAAACDLDDDGGMDLISADLLGLVRATDGQGNMLPGFPYDAGVPIKASPAVADLDDDGDLEIVILPWTGSLLILNADGTPTMPPIDIPSFVSATPALSDLDGDQDLEIVFGCYDGKLYAFHHDGSTVEGFPFIVGAGQFITEGALLMDADGDSYPEIYFATYTQKLLAVSPTGQELWQLPLGSLPAGAPAGADLGDGAPTIIVAGQNGSVQYVSAGGELRLTASLGHACRSGPAFADLNADGSLEIALNDLAGYIHVLDSQGEEVPGFPIMANGPIWTATSFSDLDNDGHLDLIVPAQTGSLYALTSEGETIPGFPLNLSGGSQSTPTLAHLDDDGDLEIIVGTSQGLDVIDYKFPAGCNECWSTFRGNMRRTGFYGDDFVGIAPPGPVNAPLPLQFALLPAHPNPFNAQVQLSFTLPQASKVQLDVFDLQGRKAATLLSGWRQPGTHNLTWSTDHSHLASGIYLLTIEARNSDGLKLRETQKVVLLK